jgi:hypothetical protein
MEHSSRLMQQSSRQPSQRAQGNRVKRACDRVKRGGGAANQRGAGHGSQSVQGLTPEAGPEQRRARQMKRNAPQSAHRARHIPHVSALQIGVVHVQHAQPACHAYSTLSLLTFDSTFTSIRTAARHGGGRGAGVVACGGMWRYVVGRYVVAMPQTEPLFTPPPPLLCTCATCRVNHSAQGLRPPPRATHQQRP